MARPKIKWVKGYTRQELARFEHTYRVTFPPDFADLLRDQRPADFFDWNDKTAMRTAFAAPLEGLLFDVENNELWPSVWGARPGTEEDRRKVVDQLVSNAPKLIPIVSHRYLPMTPAQPGNPVLSVVQSDITYFGSSLEDWLDHEYRGVREAGQKHFAPVRFWGKFIDGSWTH